MVLNQNCDLQRRVQDCVVVIRSCVLLVGGLAVAVGCSEQPQTQESDEQSGVEGVSAFAEMDEDAGGKGKSPTVGAEMAGSRAERVLDLLEEGRTQRAAKQLPAVQWSHLMQEKTDLPLVSEEEFREMPSERQAEVRQTAAEWARSFRELGEAAITVAEKGSDEQRQRVLVGLRSFGQFLADGKLAVFEVTGHALVQRANENMNAE